ncbi:MAG: Ldh family oxidoreductase [Dehalococcoidales bacterium]|nr:Ldh family oxidoreductase [Dehalococcoidales bacterium]
MAEIRTVNPEKLIVFSTKALMKMGVTEEDAKITARILVAADLRGIDSHGVAHLDPFYIKGLKTGRINAKPQIKMFSESPSTAIMDGDKGLGFVVGYKAMTEAIRRAQEVGSGFISVRNSTHYGAGAYYAMMALDHNMIGISLTQGGKGIVAPGSRGKGIGLNVISVAVPAKEEVPFVLDMATGVVAGGKLEIAKRLNRLIPEGWAVDEEGNPATEVDKATGGILPLGGTPQLGSYKGFGLTVLVDIFCSVLSGGLSSPEKEIGPNAPGPNHFFGAIRINGFMPIEEFKLGMDNMIKAHHNLPKAPGIDNIYLAGEVEQIIEKERHHGIPLHPDIIISLQKLAKELNIKYDL